MNAEQWSEVDRYIDGVFAPPEPALTAALESSTAAGLPAISVTASQGKLLAILARSIGARTALEIGTLGGYSTIWIARALAAGGSIVTLEVDPKHAELARANLARAGLANVAEVRLGAALETLPLLHTEGRGPFDLVFIDADKANIPEYFAWSLQLSRPGSLIIVDNVVRDGDVANAATTDASSLGVRRLNDRLAHEPRVLATTIQTVSGKGWDGVTIALVVA